MVPPSSHPLHHPIIFRPQTNPPTHSIPIFFLSCQGFRPHPASSWPPSEVPSSSSLVVRPCPFGMVLYQSTRWPVGHFNHHWSGVRLHLAWGPLSSQVGMPTLYCINLFIGIQCYYFSPLWGVLIPTH